MSVIVSLTHSGSIEDVKQVVIVMFAMSYATFFFVIVDNNMIGLEQHVKNFNFWVKCSFKSMSQVLMIKKHS